MSYVRGRRRWIELSVILVLLAAGLSSAADGKRVPAFPGAEGFGAYVTGGRGGRIIEVTNLNPDGPGSLKSACHQEGPRIVVFRVGGVIPRSISVRKPDLTIAGQTAPGDGICIRGSLGLSAENIILRHVRVRPGDHPLGVNPEERDCISIRRGNVIVDHCSASWSTDENVQVYGPHNNVTIQWSITSEALLDSIHPKGPHGMGMILAMASPVEVGVSVHHCLFAHNNGRNPIMAARRKYSPIYDIRNNVVYAYEGARAVQIVGIPRVNYIGNTIRRGLEPEKRLRIYYGIHPYNPADKYGSAKVFVKDNAWCGYPNGAKDPWRILAPVGYGTDRLPKVRGFERLSEPVPAPRVITEPRAQAFESVLSYAGCTRPVRDVVDDRVVAEVRAGTGGFIDSQEAVGGWPTYASAAPPADADHDGMPDAWETRYGLDPADPADGPKDADRDGYTNVEEFLNETDPKKPDTCGPTPHGAVAVQAGNEAIRGEAGREFGRKLLAERQKPDGTPGSAQALIERVKAARKDAADVLRIHMVRIEPGGFTIPKAFRIAEIRIRITKPYQIGATEVTQAQWEAVMGTRPWQGKPAVKEAPYCPASHISYIDVQEFIRRLNACGGPTWRLPTHAEWRLAAHGGTRFPYGFEDDRERVPEYAWCCYRVYKDKRMVSKSFPTTPQEVGRLKPNPFGLYNMAGNVREWVSDYASHHYFTRIKRYGADRTDPTGPKSGTTRTICGGHFRLVSRQVLACRRRPFAGHKPDYRGFDIGFRLARDVP